MKCLVNNYWSILIGDYVMLSCLALTAFDK